MEQETHRKGSSLIDSSESHERAVRRLVAGTKGRSEKKANKEGEQKVKT
jgi:hypothetical protein